MVVYSYAPFSQAGVLQGPLLGLYLYINGIGESIEMELGRVTWSTEIEDEIKSCS